MNRRHLLKSLIASTIAGSTLANSAPAKAKSSPLTPNKGIVWKNWSGNLSSTPAQRHAPDSVEALQALVKQSTSPIRVVGAGHSFSPLVPTDHTMLSIRRLAGLQSIDELNTRASFGGGTLLSEMGPVLDQHQQALINMPDIDQQTIAGAISTATHGTGKHLNCLSAYIEQLDIITADGELRSCSTTQHPELFQAAKVGLGSLGIITAVTMQNRSPFNLERKSAWLSFEEALENALQMADNNRNFEFFTIPFTGMVLSDSLNISDKAPSPAEEIDGNEALMDLKLARDTLSWSSRLRKLILGSYMKTISPEVNVDRSYAIYASERSVRFNEMEYHLPVEDGLTALREVVTLIEKHFPEVFFPIECRFIKADDLWLSPFYQRDTISIAVHRYFEEDYQPLFKAIEPVFQRYGGRPHWGKINSFRQHQFSASYPQWETFKAVRQHYDPAGKFLNPYLRQSFGIS